MAIYYRLMVRYHYERQYNVKEKALGVLFSFPPWARLDIKGRHYAKRYWIAVIIMISIVIFLGLVLDPISAVRPK